MNNDWMKARQTKYGVYVTVYVAIVLAVVGALNYLAKENTKSYDSTANKRFSISDQTEKVVKGLKSDVKIMYFDRSDGFTRAKDLLERYDAMSSKLSVDYVDVDKKPQLARTYTVRSLPAIFVEAGTKREEARGLTEEELTSSLIRVLKTGERKVCSVIGAGEHSFEERESKGMSGLKQLLEKNNYKTQSINLLEKPDIGKDCTIVIVTGPRFDYTEPAVKALVKYFSEGGRVFLALDPPLQLGKEPIADNLPLQKISESWGVKFNKNLVLDTSGIGQLFGLSELIPLVTSYEPHIIVRDMKEVATAFPLSRSLETTQVPNMNPEKLLSSSPNSYATTNLSSAEIKINEKTDKKGPFLLAVAGQMNTGKPDDPKGRYVVTGSSNFMTNSILTFNGNRDLVMNMMNWLSADEDLISIRPKDPQDRRLNLTRRQMSMVYYSSVYLLPLLAVAAGISVWWKRR